MFNNETGFTGSAVSANYSTRFLSSFRCTCTHRFTQNTGREGKCNNLIKLTSVAIAISADVCLFLSALPKGTKQTRQRAKSKIWPQVTMQNVAAPSRFQSPWSLCIYIYTTLVASLCQFHTFDDLNLI